MNKKQKKLISIAVICLLLSLIMFYYNNIKIPNIIKNVEKDVKREIDIDAMPKKEVAVIIDKNGIDKYTVLTDEIIKTKIEIKQVPVAFLIEGSVSDLNLIKDKITKEKLRYGEQVHFDSISDKIEWYGEYDRLKEFRVKTLVADTVAEGNIVDVIVNYGDGNYDVVLPKTKVIKIVSPFDSEVKDKEKDNAEKNDSQNPAKRTDDDKEFLVIFSINCEEDYRDLNLAAKLGYFETRKYFDEKQLVSKKTFNYEYAIKKLGLKEITEKLDYSKDKKSIEEIDHTSNKEKFDEGRIESKR